MQISINTPALLFPAITLLMLAYTNRFLSLASLIRKLHTEYQILKEDKHLMKAQIVNLRRRLTLIKQMQASGIFSFFLCVLSMLFIYLEHEMFAYAIFAMSLLFLLLSLALSLNEILISTRALEIELRDME
ncbi:DUF2721 domain-containing protein [soil metagenome]